MVNVTRNKMLTCALVDGFPESGDLIPPFVDGTSPVTWPSTLSLES
jgi:hypothetical protein